MFLFLLSVALAWAAVATALVLAGGELVAGATVAAAGGFLAAARSRTSRSPRLLLLAAVAERVVGAAILGAIAWMALPEEPGLAAAAMIALGGSYLVAYIRVRAVGLEFRVSDPSWFQPVVWFAVALGLGLGWAEVALWGVVLLAAVVLAVEIAGLSGQREPG